MFDESPCIVNVVNLVNIMAIAYSLLYKNKKYKV